MRASRPQTWSKRWSAKRQRPISSSRPMRSRISPTSTRCVAPHAKCWLALGCLLSRPRLTTGKASCSAKNYATPIPPSTSATRWKQRAWRRSASNALRHGPKREYLSRASSWSRPALSLLDPLGQSRRNTSEPTQPVKSASIAVAHASKRTCRSAPASASIAQQSVGHARGI